MICENIYILILIRSLAKIAPKAFIIHTDYIQLLTIWSNFSGPDTQKMLLTPFW